MTGRYEVRLAGTGGQGLIFAGVVLAEAAGVYGGLHVAQSQVYGIVSRGGASRSEVVVSNEEIDFPEIERQDMLVALSQHAFNAFARDMKPGGVVLVDPDLVKVPADYPYEVYAIPVTRIAAERVGTDLVANVVVLGALSVLTDVFKFEDLKKVLEKRGSSESSQRNLKALEEGRVAATSLKSPGGSKT